MSILISVIVPVYNVEKYLNRCVDSILAQTFTDFELILVDDGSPDNCGAICDEYAAKDSRVKVIHKENGGVSSARNAGLDIAIGEFIAFVDSDDSIDDYYLATLFENSDYDFVTAGFMMQYSDTTWHVFEFPNISTDYKNISSYPSKYMGKYYFGAPWAKLYRRKIIKDNNIYFPLDIHSGEDIIFIFKYLKYATTVRILPFSGYNYFFYNTSLVHTKSKEIFKWKISVEQSINRFFIPCNDNEQIWLCNRIFSVLFGQVKEYYSKQNKNDVYLFYHHDIFKECIESKKEHGNIKERFFIFTMEHSLYPIFIFLGKIEIFCRRVKNKLKRTLEKMR